MITTQFFKQKSSDSINQHVRGNLMLGDWYRIGDFYNSGYYVRFQNGHHKVVIKEISIIRLDLDGQFNRFEVVLSPSETQVELFFQLLCEYYPERKSFYVSHINFPLKLFNQADCHRLMKLFGAINAIEEQMPQTLIAEMENFISHLHKFFYTRIVRHLPPWNIENKFLLEKKYLIPEKKNKK